MLRRPFGEEGGELAIVLIGAARRFQEIDGEGEGAVGAAQPEGLAAAGSARGSAPRASTEAAAGPRAAAEEIGEDVAEILLGDAALLMVLGALRALGVAAI